MDQSLSISESLRFGWQTIRVQSGVVFSVALVLAVLQLLDRFLQSAAPSASLMVARGLIVILSFVFATGGYAVMLHLAREEAAVFRQILPRGRLLARVFLADLVIFGLMLAIVLPAGIIGAAAWFGLASSPARYIAVAVVGLAALAGMAYIAVRYFFAKYVAIDQSLADPEGPMNTQSIVRRAGTLTKGREWQVFKFLLVIMALYVLGAVTVIGIILSIPLTALATAHAYLKLLERHSQK